MQQQDDCRMTQEQEFQVCFVKEGIMDNEGTEDTEGNEGT